MKQSLTLYKNRDQSITVHVTDASGEDYILSENDVLVFGVKKNIDDPECLAIVTSGPDNLIDGQNGYYSIKIPNYVFEHVPSGYYIYDIGLSTITDYLTVVVPSPLTLIGNVTKKDNMYDDSNDDEIPPIIAKTCIWRGPWSDNTEYRKSDVVEFQGNCYIALKNTNAGETPLSNTTKWDLIVKSGTTPHIGNNNNWWFGDNDSGIIARGQRIVYTNNILEKNGGVIVYASENTEESPEVGDLVVGVMNDGRNVMVKVTSSNDAEYKITYSSAMFVSDINEDRFLRIDTAQQLTSEQKNILRSNTGINEELTQLNNNLVETNAKLDNTIHINDENSRQLYDLRESTSACVIYEKRSGEYISINDSAGRPVKCFEVRGKTEQNGTPSPDNPVPIQCVKSGTKIKVCAKNLFNPLYKNKRLINGKVTPNDTPGLCVSDYIDVTNYNYVIISMAGSFAWYSEKSESSLISFENKSNFIFRCYPKPIGARYFRVESSGTEPIMAQGVNYVVTNVDPYEPYAEPQEFTVPCDLYDGDTWNVLTGEVVRKNDIKEQYEPQTIIAPKGTVNVIQEPTDRSADIKMDYIADTKTYIDKKFAELQALILEG